MNLLDWLLVGLVLTYALSGYWQGFVTGAAATAILGEATDAGEAVGAVGVPRPGRRLDGAALVGHCQARLARYKGPSRIRFTERLPRNVAGKALRRALDDRALDDRALGAHAW